MTHLEIAIEATKKAGQAILTLQNNTGFETKSDGSPVTVADIASNTIIISILEQTGIPILSEESIGIPVPYPEKLWIIDPLDGTKDFIAKSDGFSVMIGLLEKGEPILGVVFAPRLGTLYYAEKNKGSFLEKNGLITKLSVPPPQIGPLRFIRSVHNYSPIMESVAHKLGATLHPHGSIGIKAGLVAHGDGDFFFSAGMLGEWDVCAPEIILTESGGMVTAMSGAPLFYGTHDHRVTNGIVFSNTHCHEKVLEAITETQKTISPTAQ